MRANRAIGTALIATDGRVMIEGAMRAVMITDKVRPDGASLPVRLDLLGEIPLLGVPE
jgi:hypothetical protein